MIYTDELTLEQIKVEQQQERFEAALTTILQVVDSVWDGLTPDQIKVMRQIESLIDDEVAS